MIAEQVQTTLGYAPGVEVVVTQYHTPSYLEACVNSLYDALGEVPLRVHVVNVAATYEEAAAADAMLERFPVESVGSVHNPVDNVGHAAACNLATLEADLYDTVFYVNADTVVPSGVIERCYETLWSDPSYAVVSPRQVDHAGRITAAGVFGTLAQPLHRDWYTITDRWQDVRDDAVTVSGALYMMKRHVWDELASCPIYRERDTLTTGAMPSVAHYYSETWVSYHCHAHGYKRVHEGRVTAIHDWHKSSPLDGWAEQMMPADRAWFGYLCDAHGIPHD